MSVTIFRFWYRDGVLARRLEPHTDKCKARNAQIVSIGHVNAATKLGGKAGLEHGRGDGGAGRLCVTSGENNRGTGHGKRTHRVL